MLQSRRAEFEGFWAGVCDFYRKYIFGFGLLCTRSWLLDDVFVWVFFFCLFFWFSWVIVFIMGIIILALCLGNLVSFFFVNLSSRLVISDFSFVLNWVNSVIISSFQVISGKSSKSAFCDDDVSSIQARGDLASRRPSMMNKFSDQPHHFWVFVMACELMAQMFHYS